MGTKDSVNNIYPQFVVESESNQYLKLKFIILEKDWPYPNFEMYIQHNDPMMFIRKELQERHGDIQQIKLYLDSEKQNELPYNFSKKIGTALNVKGSDLMEQAPQVLVYYDFKNAASSPIQLF